jgi:hypothetical protein
VTPFRTGHAGVPHASTLLLRMMSNSSYSDVGDRVVGSAHLLLLLTVESAGCHRRRVANLEKRRYFLTKLLSRSVTRFRRKSFAICDILAAKMTVGSFG